MKNMENVIYAVLIIAATMGYYPTAAAQTDDSVNLSELYQQIDEAIRQSPQYEAERECRIAACADSLSMAEGIEDRFVMGRKPFSTL